MTGAWRFWTDADCIRRWRWFPRVGKPLAHYVGPCARAAVLAPLLAVPSPYPTGSEVSALPPTGIVTAMPGGGLSGGPGNILAPGELPVLSVPLRSPSGPGSQWGEQTALAPWLPQVPTVTFLPAGVPAAVPEAVRVPEPASILLVSVGAGAAVLVRRRRG